MGNTLDGERAPTQHEIILPRRAVLAAAGGVILAAGGLLLPAATVEVEAREGKADGRLGGRHGENRRGRDRGKRRDKARARQEKPAQSAGPLGTLNVACVISNKRGDYVATQMWQFTDDDIYTVVGSWTNLPPAHVTPNVSVDYVSKYAAITVETNTGHVILSTNPVLGYPTLSIAKAGMSRDGLTGVSGYILDQEFRAGQQATAPGFQVKRLDDSKTHKRFQITFV